MTAPATTAPRIPRRAVIGLAIVAASLAVAVLSGRPGRDGAPLDPRSDGPLGTSALVSLLERLGADVELSVGLPDAGDDVALVLQDRLTEDQTDEVLQWVRGGGTLVVTDPGSMLAPLVSSAQDPGLTGDTEPVERGRCTIDALDDVEVVDGGAAVRYQPTASAGECFSDRDGAFVVLHEEGDGEIAAVGGAAFVTNDRLGEVDNAVLAAALLAPRAGTAVRFVEPPLPAGGGTETLADLVPAGLKRALIQLGVAFVLYALWRAIRLGQPVAESQPVEVAGSELVAAVGRLLERTRAPGAAADILRNEARRALATRFGVPPDADPSTLASAVAAGAPVSEEEVLLAIDDRPVRDDGELVAVARAVSRIHQEVLR